MMRDILSLDWYSWNPPDGESSPMATGYPPDWLKKFDETNRIMQDGARRFSEITRRQQHFLGWFEKLKPGAPEHIRKRDEFIRKRQEDATKLQELLLKMERDEEGFGEL